MHSWITPNPHLVLSGYKKHICVIVADTDIQMMALLDIPTDYPVM